MWMYWEQPPERPRAPYLDLCLETIEHHLGSLTLEILDEKTIFDRLPDLDEQVWLRLPDPLRRSDYARIRLLYEHGGAYLDVDCIAVSPLEKLIEPLSSNDFVTFGSERQSVQNNFFAARPGAKFLEKWLSAQERLLGSVEDWAGLPRTALGEPLATSIASTEAHYNFSERRIAPVMWYEWGRLFSRCTSPRRVFDHSPITVMLYNAFMGGHLRDTTVQDLLEGNLLISRIFRIALGRSSVEDEVDGWARFELFADLKYSTYGRAARNRVRHWVHPRDAAGP